MKILQAILLKKIQFVTTLFVVAYILNLIWENFQKPLFVGFESVLKSGITCYGAALGDALMVVGIYFVVALIRRKFYWFSIRTRDETLLLILFGFITAVLFEKFAIVTNRWEYTSLMQLIPLLNVGLVPVLQMLTLPYLSIKITDKIVN